MKNIKGNTEGTQAMMLNAEINKLRAEKEKAIS